MIVYHVDIADDGRAPFYIETTAARVPVVGDEVEMWENGEWLKVHGVVLGLAATWPTHVYLATIGPKEHNMPADEWAEEMVKAGWVNDQWPEPNRETTGRGK
jgi:hypothetical protein